jgi:large subunit ribosomal protein L22
VAEARSLLEFAVKKSSEPILKLLNSAIASAVNDLKLKEADLYVSKITVDEGPKLKRSHPMSRGRAYPILKRTSHINLTVSELPKLTEKTEPVAKEEVAEAKVAKVKKEKVTKKVKSKNLTTK